MNPLSISPTNYKALSSREEIQPLCIRNRVKFIALAIFLIFGTIFGISIFRYRAEIIHGNDNNLERESLGMILGFVGLLAATCVLCSAPSRCTKAPRINVPELTATNLQILGLDRIRYECFMLSILQVWASIPELRSSILTNPTSDPNSAPYLFRIWVRKVFEHRNQAVAESYKSPDGIVNILRLFFPDETVRLGGFGDPAEFQRLILPQSAPLLHPSLTLLNDGIIDTFIATANTDIQERLTTSLDQIPFRGPTPQMLCLRIHPLETPYHIDITPIIFHETQYAPIAGICHNLNRSSPHYFSCILNEENQWLFCNDSTIYAISEETSMRILSKHGVLLYYRKYDLSS